MQSLSAQFLSLLFVMIFLSSSRAEDADWTNHLDGTWKSDWALTKKHIETECRLDESSIQFLERLMGKMTVRYEGNHVVSTMPEIRFLDGGKERVIEGWTTEEKMEVLGKTSTQIAVMNKAVRPPLDKDYINQIHFVDADTYWIYLGNSPLTGQHVREYFRRVPTR